MITAFPRLSSALVLTLQEADSVEESRAKSLAHYVIQEGIHAAVEKYSCFGKQHVPDVPPGTVRESIVNKKAAVGKPGDREECDHDA